MSLALFANAANANADQAAKAALESAPKYFQWIHSILPEPFFHTQAFLLFFVGVFCLYWMIPRRWQMARIYLLVFASFNFYAAWSFELAFLVTATTCADYVFARLMNMTGRQRLRLLVMISSITMNLSILCYFKYRGFFLNELYDSLARFGYNPGFEKINPLSILIPFGISFYTFEAISYAVDVYRRKIEPRRACRGSCCSSCSSRTWSPGRSCEPGTSCGRRAGRSAGTGCACRSACNCS
jgi:alginate O-acetyltransferase complex protein AlgI